MGCLDKVGPGSKAPELVNVIIEIPMGGSVKYEFNKETCLVEVDRFLYTSMVYPFNYGFVPGTLEKDGDPVDILVLSREPVLPGSMITAKPIGVLVMEDEAGIDSKIIAVPKPKLDPVLGSFNDVSELDQLTRDKIKHFFEHYKELEPGKWVRVKEWKGAGEARRIVQEAIERYQKG
ncbi:MAG: inorganic diphosphatase [Desulfurococcales archaeon]|nr:inorganic diphosphatase [Desulfurococcales archaeon]